MQLQCPVYYMYGLDYLNLCNPFKNRLQNAKDFDSLPALLKFSLRQCSSESLPVSCLQNIHIQSTISTIAITKSLFCQRATTSSHTPFTGKRSFLLFPVSVKHSGHVKRMLPFSAEGTWLCLM